MSYQVLARKWRPHNLKEMVGQEHILRMLTNALDNQWLHHAYLFTGTRGVGKTTFARIFAKCLNCEQGISSNPCNECNTCKAVDEGKFLDLIEVDAASRTKVEDTRELLENIHYVPSSGRYKIYLIDEVHMLSSHSFNALLKTLEEPPSYVMFLLATTDPKKLPVTILSRCLQFNLKRVPADKIQDHLDYICKNEDIIFESDALTLLANAADGSMRDALSLLDQTIAFCGKNIGVTETRQLLGNVQIDAIFRLLTALAENNGNSLLNEARTLAEHAPNFSLVLEELLSVLHQINIAQLLPEVNVAHPEIRMFASTFTPDVVQLYYQIALIGRRDLNITPNAQQGFEMILLRMLAFRPQEISGSTPIKRVETQKPVTEKVSPATVAAPPVSMNANSNWNDILPKLNLTGLTQVLAANCTLKTITETKIELALTNLHATLLNQKATARLNEAINTYFQKPMELVIKLTGEDLPTPAKQQKAENETRMAHATLAIQNDSQVKQLLDIFEAKIDECSIKPIKLEKT